MLDRLISGAGAVTDGADRSVRAVTGGSHRGAATTRPGSLLVVALLLVLAGMLLLAGLEATDPSTPVTLAPAEVAGSRDLGDRTFATIHGAFSSAYAEYFSDDNDNGTEDEGESPLVWYYWLVDRDARAGVTVRSVRPPEAFFTFRGAGVLTDISQYTREAVGEYEREAIRAGLTIEPDVVLDTTNGSGRAPTTLDLAGPMPPTGTSVELTGARLGSFVGICWHEPVVDPNCYSDDQDSFEVLVYDRTSRHAIRVLVRDLPEFTEEADLTGLLRREERAVDDAKTGAPYDMATLDLEISDRYILDEAAAAGSAPLAFGLAGLVAALAGVILVGLAGGYLIYRRSDTSLPLAATTLGPGERIPLRVTGILRTPTGVEHVREAPGNLVRFVLGRPVTTSVAPVASDERATPEASVAQDDTDSQEASVAQDETDTRDPADASANADPSAAPVAPAPAQADPDVPPPADPAEEPPIATTLIVERADTPQGIAVGLGELERLSSGQVMTMRAPRPALRVVAGTGPLVLSFDSEAERDRAAAELLDETGLGPDGTKPSTS